MDLKQFFTEYDDSITGASQLDPLGIRIIWQGLGQSIFQNMVSSIANDARNYTLSLFLHHIIRKISNGITFSPKQEKHWENPHDLIFKQRLFIFLENLYIFSFVDLSNENDQEVNTTGVLGIRKGTDIWGQTTEQRQKKLRIAKKGTEILANQLSLGVLGRYKTPFVKMNLMSSQLDYKQYNNEAWDNFQDLIDKSDLKKLEKLLISIVEDLFKTQHAEPVFQWNDKRFEELKKSFKIPFKDTFTVGKLTKEFWLKQTNLDQGIAKEIFDKISITGKKNPFDLYSTALKTAKGNKHIPPCELNKLSLITQVEPLLAEISLIFIVVCAHGVASLDDLEKHMGELQRKLKDLSLYAEKLPKVDHLSDQAEKRLEDLKSIVIDQASWGDVVDKLSDYHTNIMTRRGLNPWFKVKENSELRHYAKLYPLPNKDKVAPFRKYWTNSYYFYDLRDLKRGLMGEPQQ